LAKQYPVRGVDVSHYQGKIDFDALADQGMRFAFIKATEGSTHVDPMLEKNSAGIENSDMRAGFYHFFSFDSPGESQADHFIRTVIPFAGMLPPVIDLEFYGAHAGNPPDSTAVRAELDAMLSALEAHYGLKPILYATEESYECYLVGAYEEYDIWIRNVIAKPHLSDNRAWTFWQYTNRGRLDGYAGEEPFIDINVFCGTAEEFSRYPRYMQ
jgi:lysozyme